MCDCCDFAAARGGTAGDPALVAAWERKWRAETAARIEEEGWTTLSVDSVPPVSYTIGLWGARHPELVVVGLDAAIGQNVLGVVADLVRRGGVTLSDGDRLGGDAFAGWEFAVFDLPDPARIVRRANTFYRRAASDSVPACQLVYPDVHGTWPWEPGCHLDPGMQPMPGSVMA